MALVEKTLKGQSFDEALTVTTPDGLTIQPLYTAEDGVAVARDLRARDPERPWDLRVRAAHPDPVRVAKDVVTDLEGGAASVLLQLDPTGANGVAVGSAENLSTALSGVMLDLAPVALDAGFLGPKAADWLGALAKAAPNAPLAFHMDPLTAFAQAGVSPGPIESHVFNAATVGSRLAQTYVKASLFLATGRAAHEAGGSNTEELAVMTASALAYAKALVRSGLSMDEAFGRIVLGVSLDGEYFTGVAKLRAAKAMWARLTEACGVSVAPRIEARSSRRMLAKADAWTNLLRLTSAGFAGAIGGADAILLDAFTDAIGLPTTFARRQARNTQLVLMEESHLGRVADPAGGAWYLDNLTDQLARAAWGGFQAIEGAGGMIKTLESGLVADAVAATRSAQEAAFADKRRKILGVTAFPNADDKPPEVETPDASAFAVDSPDVRLPGPDSRCPALTPVRFAAAFEGA
ncbi:MULTISPECIES: methylmalonyl-CoA mutase subunit beta [unclassified Caulobacter]|uniref:methylmalonyl-CoA mutase subunit beta n=1 Tax=unclassified Caulobacter TaxID=2648921 RepID=UPI0006FC9B6F|nr:MULTISPECIES: methylmalonyl-CoA mutase subunit beta [unclassified Caulobacter]KQV58928.1 methylmalonyl-CoA mutase [Caulobacter sp. Root342]KQV69398.1 methylmalonyl-CoA mutase [Caulobacter sp. Root343]